MNLDAGIELMCLKIYPEYKIAMYTSVKKWLPQVLTVI